MQTAICLLSVVPMRKEPSHRSEMVSQILFGEYVTMEEEKDDFVKVTCVYDGYEGWVQTNQLTPVPEEQILTTTKYICFYTEEIFLNQLSRMMPFGTPVYHAKSHADPLQLGNQQISYPLEKGVWESKGKPLTKESLERIVCVFLDTPYLWGGKSVYGIDCSGFAQQVFKFFAIKLLRDAYLQADQGTDVKSLGDAKFGDLAFFQNEKGRVTHVGILLENNQIVHASGKVRIDTIDKEGILNKENGKRTHQFHSIRRFF